MVLIDMHICYEVINVRIEKKIKKYRLCMYCARYNKHIIEHYSVVVYQQIQRKHTYNGECPAHFTP